MKAKLAVLLKKLAEFFQSSLTYVVFFALFGAFIFSFGVSIIGGIGAGLIAGGIFCIAYMLMILRGMSNG